MGLIPRQTLTVTRPIGGSYINGKWSIGSTIVGSISASVQPLTSKELEALPESRRASGESYKLYADTVLILQTVVDDENPDIVSILGEDFEVFSVERWQNMIINHAKYIVTRKTSK